MDSTTNSLVRSPGMQALPLNRVPSPSQEGSFNVYYTHDTVDLDYTLKIKN